MKTPESERKGIVVEVVPFVYDFEFCADQEDLHRVMNHINRYGYDLVSVTQDPSGIYTVFFRRLACG